MQADAADETAVANICKQALQDEGRLDVFFANVRACHINSVQDMPDPIPTGRDCYLSASLRCIRRAVHELHARERVVVSVLTCCPCQCYAVPDYPTRCFLAVKYGSEAMQKTNSSRGKEHSGGSIILTASGKKIFRVSRSVT